MKLILTSDGLSSRKIKKQTLKLLNKPAVENKVLIMYTAKKNYKRSLRKVKKQLKSIGINNLIYANISKNVKPEKFKDFDIFYSCGGNTFYIIDRVRKTGFDKLIKKFIKSNKLYIGVSAGSIIVHKTIDLAGWGRERDINEINLRNLGGLKITNIAILPHYKKRLKKEIDEFTKLVDYPVIRLKDKQALVIIGKKVRKI